MNNDVIEKRIAHTEELIGKVSNKTTLAYLEGLFSLKSDYEVLEDVENSCKYADMIIDLLCKNAIVYNNTKENVEKVGKILVSSYDTKARNGDFKAFCIAMEFNRPINKQFFIPRMRLLEKHGVVQGVQDLIDDKLDLLVLNLPPRIGKSTVGLFLQALLGGMCPDESILACGHTTGLIDSFYDEIINYDTMDDSFWNWFYIGADKNKKNPPVFKNYEKVYKKNENSLRCLIVYKKLKTLFVRER